MNIEELKTQLKDGVKKAWPDGTVVTGEISIGGRTVVLVVTKDNEGDWASKIKDNSKSLHKIMIGAFDKEGNADKVTAELTVRGMGVPRGVLKKKTAPPDKIVKYLLDYFSKVEIGESKADKIINDVANLSTVTLHKLLKDEKMTNVKLANKIHQKFIQFVYSALDSDPSAYSSWKDAWNYFSDTYDLSTLKLKNESVVSRAARILNEVCALEYIAKTKMPKR